MDPITILGISLASIVAGEAVLAKAYFMIRKRFQTQEPEHVSSQVSDTM